MANYIVSDTNLTAVANAIRQKGGTSASLEFPDDFIEAIGDIETGGGSSVTVEALNVTQNGTYTAPSGTAYSPVTVSVSGSGGTDYLEKMLKNTLTTYSNSDVTSIPEYAFHKATGLQTVSFPNVTSIGQYAFNGCTGLTSASVDKVTSLGGYCFTGCTSLTSISLPNYNSNIPTQCFRNCKALTTVELKSNFSGSVPAYGFGGCSNLEVLDLKNCDSIAANGLNGCSKLNTLILRKSSVCSLSNTTALNDTPFSASGTGGTLYVPNDLISTYQSASNWSNILGYANNQIKKIEGSIYE